MFDRLAEGIGQALQRVRGQKDDTAREAFLAAVRDRLHEADTHPDVVRDLVERLTARLSRSDTESSLSPSERFLKGLREEVLHILGERPEPLRLRSNGPSSILVVGLQGTGKTTSVGKLARLLRDEGKQVLLVPLDVKRPAAIEQLGVLGRDLGVEVWPTPAGGKPVKIAREAAKEADRRRFDVILYDTAGRLAIDRELMDEIRELRDSLRPQEVLYVLDAMAGQTAVQTAERFSEAVRPTGILLTKVDADPRGGAVLSVRARTGIPVKFMGTGEKLAALEPFDPDRITGRLLDLGDITGLAEKFDKAIDQDEAGKLTERFMSGKFNLDDFARQLEMMGNLGSLEGVLGMLPGGKGLLKQAQDLGGAEREMKRTLAILRSMTPLERRNPKLMGQRSRQVRVARGSGSTPADVSKVLKRYDTMQKMMKQLKRFPVQALQGLLGGKGGGGFGGFGGPGGGLPPGLGRR
jgi:signal recognition particle subunit SRP54